MLLSQLLLLAFSLTLSHSASTGPIVDLGYAKYQGVNNATTGLNTFFGIRYAAAPTSDLRWRAPQTPQPTTGVLDATIPGPQCFQGVTGQAPTQPFPNPGSDGSVTRRAIASSEDCLLLNVYSPTAAKTKKLPVIVWIHGGGYVGGNEDSPGEDLVHNSQDQIVAVLIQYRLGVFGFLPGTEVKNDGTLNAGTLDQQFALQWVQEHISKFGGNPNEVTIWGESAGAGSVLQHIIANGGNTRPPLFKRGLTSSTFLPFQYQYNDRIPEQLFAKTVQEAGCAGQADAMACLRAVDAGLLETVNMNICATEFFGEFQYVPVIDGTFIQDSPVSTISRGKLNGEILLAITNPFEGAVFVSSATANGTLTQYVTNAIPTFDEADVNSVVEIYSNIPGLNTVLSQAIAVQGELIFICPTYFLLDAFGSRSHKGEFAIPPGNHGDDVAYYFNTPPPRFNNAEFIASFSQAFSDVTVSGDVNKKVSSANKTPFWPAWSSNHTEMLFNVTADFTTPVIHTIQTDPMLLQRCDFWKSMAPKAGQ